MIQHPNRIKWRLAAEASIAANSAKTTAERLADMSDTQLQEESAFFADAVARADAKVVASRPKKRWWQRRPKVVPLPPEQTGYRSPSFQAYLARKSLGYVHQEMLAREKKRSSGSKSK
jgi:hypothetical protein